jgi:hypothetical protein
VQLDFITKMIYYFANCIIKDKALISKSEQILQDALELPPVERAELAENLLASFLLPLDKNIDALWAQEAEYLIDAYEDGLIKSISAKKVFDKLTSPNQ